MDPVEPSPAAGGSSPMEPIGATNDSVTPSVASPSKPAKVSISRSVTQTFAGPLPHPTILAGYEKVLPGAAERIIRAFEKEGDHRRACEDRALTAQERETGTADDAEKRLHALGARGQVFGFVIALVGLGASVACAVIGQPVVAGILGGSTLVGLVAVFVVGQLLTPRSEPNTSDTARPVHSETPPPEA